MDHLSHVGSFEALQLEWLLWIWKIDLLKMTINICPTELNGKMIHHQSPLIITITFPLYCGVLSSTWKA